MILRTLSKGNVCQCPLGKESSYGKYVRHLNQRTGELIVLLPYIKKEIKPK